MGFIIKVPEYSIKEQGSYTVDLSSDSTREKFPILTIDKGSYISELEIMYSFLSCNEQLYNFQIGRYNSVASGIKVIIDADHDYKKVFQGRIRNFPYEAPVRINRKGQVIIQNDCWIGIGATILGGVTIHNGAVVAAYAVVAKDVPPYAIVVGNPARVVAYRFNPEEIEALQRIAWWQWSDEKIQLNQKSLNSDINHFINDHIDNANDYWDTIPKIDVPRIIPNVPGYLFFVDLYSEYSLCEKVVFEFAKKFCNQEAELILYVNEDTSSEILTLLDGIIKKYCEYNCVINILSGFSYDERIIFNCVDFYITNRNLKNVRRMCIADLLNVCCVSGVDSIIFR